jgi:DnaA regulatory inactivator Hda
VTARQIPLDLGHRPALKREDFLVAPSNAAAVGWLDRWPDWPHPVLVIHGPEGAGKSHLAEAWRERCGAKRIEAGELSARGVPALTQCALVIEDLDRGVDETGLFHLYNMMTEARRFLLLTARTAPVRWPLLLADLRSRLLAAPAVRLEAPDEALIGAVLVKAFADRQLRVGEDVVLYLLARMERSFAAVRETAIALDRLALAERRAITIPLVRQLLHDREAERPDRNQGGN